MDILKSEIIFKSEEVRKTFDCPICYGKIDIDGSYELKCGCQYCENCLKELLENYIKNAVVENDFKCPSCEKEIDYEVRHLLISTLCGEDKLQKHEEFAIRNLPNYKRYPNAECSQGLLIEEG